VELYTKTSFESKGTRELVSELDKWIVGQHDAKKAVAIAMRSRWRRNNLDSKKLQNEIIPKNILMIGPTGVGKTEIARRMAKLTGAPFIKVEATKYTEVGFKGQDVEQMVEDLMHVAYKSVVEKEKARLKPIIDKQVEETLLKYLLGDVEVRVGFKEDTLHFLRNKQLEDVRIATYEPPNIPNPLTKFKTGHQNQMPDLTLLQINSPTAFTFDQVIAMLNSSDHLVMPNQTKKREKHSHYSIAEIRNFETEAELAKLISEKNLIRAAIHEAENYGIIFIDEFDKIAKGSDFSSSAVSSEGVQRDLLPIIEGTKVHVKNFGDVDTTKMLFIASGAFLITKPSNLIAELQGRLPIRVKLADLTVEDLYRILTEPEVDQVKQQKYLLQTEGIDLRFTDEALREIAKKTYEFNRTHDNLGARRLFTVLEKVLEDISFNASRYKGATVIIDEEHIQKSLKDLEEVRNLKKFIF